MNILRTLAIVIFLLFPIAANADLIITDTVVTVGDVDERGEDNFGGGTVDLSATGGALTVGSITTDGGDDVDDSGGNDAGDVSLNGSTTISVGDISAKGSVATTGSNPDGTDGDVLVTSNGSVVVGGSINAGQIDIFIDTDEATVNGAESLEIQGALTAATINLYGGAATQDDTLFVSLTEADTATWRVSGNNSGTLTAGTSSAATFTNFSELQGGDQEDTFEIMDYVSYISGGAGNDSYIFGEDASVGQIFYGLEDDIWVQDLFAVTPNVSAGDDLFLLGFLQFNFNELFYRDTLADGFSSFASIGGYGGSFASDPLDPFRIIASVPEPGTLALFGIGLLGMGAARRRKKA